VRFLSVGPLAGSIKAITAFLPAFQVHGNPFLVGPGARGSLPPVSYAALSAIFLPSLVSLKLHAAPPHRIRVPSNCCVGREVPRETPAAYQRSADLPFCAEIAQDFTVDLRGRAFQTRIVS